MIDARGLSCPQPVVKTQQAIKQDLPASLDVLVDDFCAVENITRLCLHLGYRITVTERDGEFQLLLERQVTDGAEK